MAETMRIEPQPGYQMQMLSTSADIAIGGGAAGAGKTWSLLMEPVRHIKNKEFGAVIFRRESPMITNQNGLWDESGRIYPLLKAVPRQNVLDWTFPGGARVRFAHMQHANDRFAWDGAQLPFVGWDQLEQFEEVQFWHLLGRMRSMSGIQPYMRATCNPVPDDDPIGGWLHKLISWWIDQQTGLPIQSRSGVLRWIMRPVDVVEWSDAPTREAAIGDFAARFPQLAPIDIQPKSITFIPGLLEGNVKLMERDPSYRANLLLLPQVERERRLGGNWKVKASAGKVFNRAWFKTRHTTLPHDITRWVRYWDKAGTEGGGKFSSGVLMGLRPSRAVVLADIVRGQWSYGNREAVIAQTAEADRVRCGEMLVTWVEQEPGSGGKESAENTRAHTLAGHHVKLDRVTKNKLGRAGPLSSAAEAGNVELMQFYKDEHSNTEAFLTEAQNYNGATGYMDQIDAASGAYNKLMAAGLGQLDIVTGAPATAAESSDAYQSELEAALAAYGAEEEVA